MQNLLSQVPGPQYINNNLVGDGLNTGGYRFNQRDNETRDNVTGKLDYNITTRHAVSASYLLEPRQLRPARRRKRLLGHSQGHQPDALPTLLALSWRWTPSARLTNEVRAGFNLTYGILLHLAAISAPTSSPA